ncbi:MAG TPA: energy transducer TonB, partial [Pyrinomonadaceae bacterium]
MKILFFTFILLCGAINVFAQTEVSPVQQVTAGVINGTAISLPKPEYPAEAKAARAGGSVRVQVTIDEKGDVISTEVLSGHPLFQQAAVAAARQAKFKPTLLEGKPIKVTAVIVYNFNSTPSSASAKQNRPDKVVLFIGLSLFLTSLKDIEPDEDAYIILRGLTNNFPSEYASERERLNKLATAKRSEHARIIDDFIVSFGRRLSGTELWLFDLGKHWGTAIGQAYKLSGLSGNNLRGDKVKFIDS